VNVCIYVNIVNVCIFTIIIRIVSYRIVSKITISSPFVSIRIVLCDDRIVSFLINTSQIIQRITDIYQQSWYSRINNSSKLQSYSLFKHSYTREPYLDYITTKKYRIALTKLRVSSHSLHIETGRYINTPRALRTCTNCNMNQPETNIILF